MSVLLSTTICVLFSLCYIGNNTLQVGSLRDAEQNWMVFGLGAKLNQPQAAVGIEGSRRQHFQEVERADVIGTGAGHEHAAGAQHLQRAEVQLFVPAEGSVEVALRLGKGRRVENDGVVAAVGGGIILEQVEGIGLNPFNLRLFTVTVEDGVLEGDFERGARTVNSGDAGAARGEVQGEASL